MLKLINTVLLLAAAVGCYFAIDAGLSTQRLRADHQALAAEVGLLTITDPDKVHVLALKRDNPLDFAWQVYVPANFRWNWKVALGNSGSSSSSGSGDPGPYQQLVRVKLRQEANGEWQMWTKTRNSSSLMGLNRTDGELLQRGEEVLIERAGVNKVLVLERDQICQLLGIRKHDTADGTPLIHIRLGSDEAFRKAVDQKHP